MGDLDSNNCTECSITYLGLRYNRDTEKKA